MGAGYLGSVPPTEPSDWRYAEPDSVHISDILSPSRAPSTGPRESVRALEQNPYDRILVRDPLNTFLMFSDPDTHPKPQNV